MHKKILLVEDDATSRLILGTILKRESRWEVSEASDGEAALDLLCDGLQPDVCLVDLQMPKMDGHELVKRIRGDPLLQNLKIIITSASRDKDSVALLAKLKISGYLLKPYDPGKVHALLQKIFQQAGTADPLFSTRNLLAKTALVAEGNREQRVLLLELIKKVSGWDAVGVPSCEEAVDRLYGGMRPDLVILGLDKPTPKDLTVVQKIRTDPQLHDLRIVICSCGIDRDGVLALAKLNITGLLLKPVDSVKVQATLLKAN